MDPITLRSVERILAVVVGGLCIYLGYCLFLHIPEQRDGEGKFNAPGGVSIFITRVGPGTFFALFGTAVVGLAVHRGVSYRREDQGGEEPNDKRRRKDRASKDKERGKEEGRTTIVSYGGLTPRHESNTEGRNRARLSLRLEMEFLNKLPSLLRENLGDELRKEVERARRATKLALMRSVWGPDWGDYDEFEVWAEAGSPDDASQGLEPAAVAYYLNGEGAAK